MTTRVQSEKLLQALKFDHFDKKRSHGRHTSEGLDVDKGKLDEMKKDLLLNNVGSGDVKTILNLIEQSNVDSITYGRIVVRGPNRTFMDFLSSFKDLAVAETLGRAPVHECTNFTSIAIATLFTCDRAAPRVGTLLQAE
ncbi:hypothetical protein RF11_06330 [Thelohanellus kitauei]|uniref:Uncharacterized protein n=1 Tax=Thelohanellus kitauei TaxID=669202 RepID=A0A0C2IGX8_THEKT|nr:hypothetical protein RF11_06330 [Thelohanellus kitauei]